jgi:hypothetical protein
MSTHKKNTGKEAPPEDRTPEGIKKVNNPVENNTIPYQKPTITLVNKPVSLEKADSPDGVSFCVSCFMCYSCVVGCVGCVNCQGVCQICVGCQGCNGPCVLCQTCVACVDGCDTCVGCVTGDTSLPVTLTTFNAIRKKNSVLLSWRTESETNNLGFFLFKALDKEGPFEPVNTQIIPGAGSSSEGHDYEYVDRNVDAVTTYWYLLEDVDTNGQTETRGPIECKPLPDLSSNRFRLSTNYPNPFNAQTSLSITLPESGQIEVLIVDMNGRTVRTLRKGPIESGTHVITWDCRNNRGASVPSGTYICRVRFEGGETFVLTQKISYIR